MKPTYHLARESSAVKKTDDLAAAVINGDSLIGDAIHDGDVVIIRKDYTAAELTPGRLAAVETPDGLLVKHCYLTLDDQIRLVSSNPDYGDLLFESGQAAVIGVVVRVERDIGGDG